MRRYSDAQLSEAIASSHSWRGVLRILDLSATSAAAMRSVRRQADRLALDYTHFRGQRRWSDKQLAAAVGAATSWTEVADTLGLSGGSSTTTIRGHAVRLGLDTPHLASRVSTTVPAELLRPRPHNLRRAGSLMAAAWFELCGHPVFWPLEPGRYDLLVWRDGGAERIQVKTSPVRTRTSWTVSLSTTGKGRTPYDPDEIDQFFVIDSDLNYDLIPVAVVGGLKAIQLSAYHPYRLSKELDEPVESEPCPS